jgi:hypothetical protein
VRRLLVTNVTLAPEDHHFAARSAVDAEREGAVHVTPLVMGEPVVDAGSRHLANFQSISSCSQMRETQVRRNRRQHSRMPGQNPLSFSWRTGR